jgi:hypothetical protein
MSAKSVADDAKSLLAQRGPEAAHDAADNICACLMQKDRPGATYWRAMLAAITAFDGWSPSVTVH